MDSGFSEVPVSAFLNLNTGKVHYPEDEEEESYWENDEFISLPDDLAGHYGRGNYGVMKSFVESLDPGSVQDELTQAISGRGAFRNFKNIVFGGGDVALKHNWHWFETRSQREWIEEWLEENGIEPKWDRDIFEPPSLPDKRPNFYRPFSTLSGTHKISGASGALLCWDH